MHVTYLRTVQLFSAAVATPVRSATSCPSTATAATRAASVTSSRGSLPRRATRWQAPLAPSAPPPTAWCAPGPAPPHARLPAWLPCGRGPVAVQAPCLVPLAVRCCAAPTCGGAPSSRWWLGLRRQSGAQHRCGASQSGESAAGRTMPLSALFGPVMGCAMRRRPTWPAVSARRARRRPASTARPTTSRARRAALAAPLPTPSPWTSAGRPRPPRAF